MGTKDEFFYRSSEDEKQQPKVAEEEDAVTIIDEAPNAIVFFCKLLLTSVWNPEPELTKTHTRKPNTTEHYNYTKTTDTLLTIINTKDLVVLFCE